MSNLLGDSYKQLYDNYYEVNSVADKRHLAAVDTYDHIRGLVGAARFDKVIDVGAGEGALLQLLDRSEMAQRLYALEISESGRRAIEARKLSRLAECQSFDGYQIPYPDQFFDLVISIHVLEHVEHERLMLKELRRVGKRLVIEIPLEGGLRVDRSIALSGQYGHINFYTPPTFRNLLRTTGFRILGAHVVTSSLPYEQYCAGKLRGLVKHAIRRGFLRMSERLAPQMLTYLMAAYCEAE